MFSSQKGSDQKSNLQGDIFWPADNLALKNDLISQNLHTEYCSLQRLPTETHRQNLDIQPNRKFIPNINVCIVDISTNDSVRELFG